MVVYIDVFFIFFVDFYGFGLNDEKKCWVKGWMIYSCFWCFFKLGSVVYCEKDGEWMGCVVFGINFL